MCRLRFVFHVLALEGGPDNGKFSLCRFPRSARAQSALDYQIVPSAVLQRIRRLAVQALGHPERNEDAGENETVQAGKGRWGHADDRENHPVEAQGAADHGAVAGVILLPEVVADYRDGLGGLKLLRQAETRGRLKASRLPPERSCRSPGSQSESVPAPRDWQPPPGW